MGKCCKCKSDELLLLHICENCFNQDKEKTIHERISVLVQTLRLVNRHLDGMSGLTTTELKDYINTTLKLY